ncbi:Hpt domain-containing protein [uncultured Vibrio sp.]|uniref:Hpt domain-containing protein n=1 Tax=uncultured Vibrio sp. TaxID=114054 RepID=UPI00260196A7|nr:Hpt domain-containing protein [uncultured Vibrio sp.]
MEQLIAKPKRFKKPTTVLVVLLALWLLPSLAMLNLSRSYTHSVTQIEELGIRVSELRQALYFSEPLQISRINDLALDAQLVYSIRLQIESDFQHALFRPDVNQLLYVADQFLKKFDEFLPIEGQVQDIVDNIKRLRADTELSPALKPLLNEFGVVVFEAMYSDNQSSPVIYRTFDSILDKSYSLKTEEQEAIQQLLADASALLGDYAQLNYLVDKIKQNSVNEQIIKLEAEFHERQFTLLLAMLGLSATFIVGLVLWGVRFDQDTFKEKEDAQHNTTDIEGGDDSCSLAKHNVSSAPQSFEPKTTHVESELTHAQPPVAAHVNTKQSVHPYKPAQDDHQHNLNNKSARQQVAARQTPEKSSSAITECRSAIDVEAMLETMDNDAESVALLLGVFISDHTDDFDKFTSLLSEDETSAVRIVHSLKSVAGTIKASSLATIAGGVESTMKQSKPISEHDLKELELAIKAAVDSAAAYLDNRR